MRPTRESLLAALQYNPETGEFRYAVSCGGFKAGDLAGSLDAYGYRVVKIRGKSYKAHRLAWLAMTGVWPEKEIDHKNRARDDNRIANLRVVDRSENVRNSGMSPRNRSGYRGVAFHRATGKYQANFKIHGTTHYLGLYLTPEAASRAYEAARMERES